jgi:DNA-binding transcriptional ArsR family regulator
LEFEILRTDSRYYSEKSCHYIDSLGLISPRATKYDILKACDCLPDNSQGKEDKKEKAPKKEILSKALANTGSFNIDSDLRGRTLQSYLFMIKNSKPIGVRELQRSLGLSSPSVAFHHLEKLEKMGLVVKDQYGEYTCVKNVDVSVLQAFSRIGRLLVPRFTFYAMFFTTLLLGYLVIFQSSSNVFAVVFGAFACGFAWYETFRTWSKRPF